MAIRKDDSELTDSDITRREFVGGALLGPGTVFLGIGSPAAIRSAAAQTIPAPMTGLGLDWTGPGGVGDYARANGNTAEVVNAARGAIRNHERNRGIATASAFDACCGGSRNMSALCSDTRSSPRSGAFQLFVTPA